MLKIAEFLHQQYPSLFFVLFSLYFLRKWLISGSKRAPPSPPTLPILGNLHQLSAPAHQSLQRLGAKHGPLMLLHFGSKPVIIVQSADAAREIIKTNDRIFVDKPHSRATKRLFYNLKDITVAPHGEYWRKLKVICVVRLLSAKMVQSFDSIRQEETAILMGKIESSSGPLNLSELFVTLANDIICRAAFGRKYGEGESGKKFLILLVMVLELIGRVNIGDYIPWLSWIDYVSGFHNKVDKVAREVDEFLELVLQEHLMNQELKNKTSGDDGVNNDEDETSENFVEILLNVYKDNQTGVSIDRDSIQAIILDIFAGGTDTTSVTLEWTMTELLRHPVVMKKLQNDVREIMREKLKQGIITHEELAKMHYLKAVVKESVRLHPPVPFLARVAGDNVQVLGYEIAAGTMVIVNAYAIGRDHTSWDKPEKFVPERFLSCSVDFKGLDFELIPFGAGRRGCPGIGFAMAEVELVLANLVHKLEWELPDGISELDVIEQPGVTTHRKNPLFAVATPSL